jgi:ribose 5-phosphate isomerase B
MTRKIKIIIGSDHAGFNLKTAVIKHLKETGISVEDAGCNSEESCDYPEYGKKVAGRVAEGDGLGILICGTGIGMSIAANKISGVRAALCNNEYTARMSRMHNNANILVLGSRVIGEGTAYSIIDAWLNTDFEGGRHQKRIDMFES